jgi:fatty acid desaturase
MLAPQYSLRRLLALVTLSGFGCLIVAMAMWGHLWAWALVIALLGLAVTICVHALVYAVSRLIGEALHRRKQSQQATAAAPAPASQ